MAVKRRTWILVAVGMLALAGCSSGVKQSSCATDAGARVCVTHTSSARHFEVQATGFQPNSDINMSPDTPAAAASHPLALRSGADGTYSNKGDVIGLVGGADTPATITLTFSGVTTSGMAVSVPVQIKR